jgi:hypothetical protein
MKLNIVKAISIAGLVFISQLTQAQAAPSVPVIDTFVVGQPLTAAQLNTIKALAEYNTSNISSNTSSINALNTPAVYAIGDTGPAGGIVFYVTAGGLRGLEAAPTDQGSLIRWDSAQNAFTDYGAIADGVGAGDMNTMLIIAEAGGFTTTYAAGVAANLVITSAGVDYDDWYLPSRFELNLMWTNLADSDGDGSNTGGGDEGNLGGFAATFNYWSSSQIDANWASNQNFGDGSQGELGSFPKSTTLRVRAVRAF